MLPLSRLPPRSSALPAKLRYASPESPPSPLAACEAGHFGGFGGGAPGLGYSGQSLSVSSYTLYAGGPGSARLYQLSGEPTCTRAPGTFSAGIRGPVAGLENGMGKSFAQSIWLVRMQVTWLRTSSISINQRKTET